MDLNSLRQSMGEALISFGNKAQVEGAFEDQYRNPSSISPYPELVERAGAVIAKLGHLIVPKVEEA